MSPAETWIVGELEGDFEGATASEQAGDGALKPGGRLFGLRLLRGHVRGVRLCEGPPPEKAETVFRQDVLRPAWLETTRAGEEATFAETALHDVELHDVRIERQVEEPAAGLLASISGRELAAGVLRATIYARLPEATPPPEPIAPPLPTAPGVGPVAVEPRQRVVAPPAPAPAATSCLWPGWLWAFLTLAFFVFLWLRCSLRLALVWLGGLVLARLLRCLVWRLGWLVPRTRIEAAVVRALSLVYAVLWTLAVFNWCSARSASVDSGCCGGGLWSKLRHRVEESLSHDSQADQVSDATRVGSGTRRRISLDEALAEPSAFFDDCARTIYLSDDLLFDWSRATLKPGAEVQLRKLARLLEGRPDARIRLVGHADASGAPDYNVHISSLRAGEVARWLETEAAIPASRLETVGRGADEPIVTDPAQWRLNRRVEVALPCPVGR